MHLILGTLGELFAASALQAGKENKANFLPCVTTKPFP